MSRAKVIFSIMMFALPPLSAAAQASYDFFEGELYESRTIVGNFHDFSSNPNRIGLWEIYPGNLLFAQGQYTDGANRMSMESGRYGSVGFVASGGHKFKNLDLWGGFKYAYGRHIDRAWADTFSPYNGNPFQTGHNTAGNYVEQRFDYKIALSSKKLWKHFRFGLGHNYLIADLSRTNDPRSRCQRVALDINPSFTAEWKDHTLGLTLNYRYDKERIGSYISKAQSGQEYYLFLQEGMGIFSRLVSTSYSRRTIASYYGLDLDYAWRSNKFSVFISPGFNYRSDAIEDENRLIPGNYKAYEPEFKTVLDSRTGKGNLIRFILDASYTGGKSNKNWTEKRTEVDSKTGIAYVVYDIVLSLPFYAYNRADADVQLLYYQLDKVNAQALWYAGAGLHYNSLQTSNVFYVPNSTCSTSGISLTAKGGGKISVGKGHSLSICGNAGFRKAFGNSIYVNPSSTSEYDVYDNVTLHDYQISSSDNIILKLELSYRFPLLKRLFGLAGASCSSSIVPYGPYASQHRTCAEAKIGISW